MISHENVKEQIRKWFQVLSRFMVDPSFILHLSSATSYSLERHRSFSSHDAVLFTLRWNSGTQSIYGLLFTITCILGTEFLYDEDILWMTTLKQRKSLYMFHIPQTDTQIPADLWQKQKTNLIFVVSYFSPQT